MLRIVTLVLLCVLVAGCVSADGYITDKKPYKYTCLCVFFNLKDASKVGNYQPTTRETVEQWLRPDSQMFSLDEFEHGYWSELSYGKLDVHIDAFRDRNGNAFIPTIEIADPQDWGLLTEMLIKQDPEGAWKQAGSNMQDGRRIIENVAVMQNFNVGVSATVGIPARRFVVDGITYDVNTMTHMPPRMPGNTDLSNPSCYSGVLTTLEHEHSHNFVQAYDSYGGHGGKIGYWEILGDCCPPGMMSENFSFYKQAHGWIKWKEDIKGPILLTTTYRLKPYSDTGEAIKITPSPILHPTQWFILEARCQSMVARWQEPR